MFVPAHEAAQGGSRQPTAEADAPYPKHSDPASVSPIALPITKLTGFGATALTIAAISSRVLMPGA
jgi:hypothetical protein